MQFWYEHYDNFIYSLDYDLLKSNQEDETRKLFNYLDLEWQSDCLFPHKNTRLVKTSSFWQVRQKVYQGSSQQWKKFEPFLKGVLDKL